MFKWYPSIMEKLLTWEDCSYTSYFIIYAFCPWLFLLLCVCECLCPGLTFHYRGTTTTKTKGWEESWCKRYSPRQSQCRVFLSHFVSSFHLHLLDINKELFLPWFHALPPLKTRRNVADLLGCSSFFLFLIPLLSKDSPPPLSYSRFESLEFRVGCEVMTRWRFLSVSLNKIPHWHLRVLDYLALNWKRENCWSERKPLSW